MEKRTVSEQSSKPLCQRVCELELKVAELQGEVYPQHKTGSEDTTPQDEMVELLGRPFTTTQRPGKLKALEQEVQSLRQEVAALVETMKKRLQ